MNISLIFGFFVCFCTIESEQSTQFLRTILTTTPSTSHISNFRNQPRSDSRADKPDTFAGFDLQDEDTTPSSTHKRRQAYSHLLRMFLQKTRERLETIREVAKHERALAKANRVAAAAAAVTAQANDNQSIDNFTESGDLVLDSDDDDEPILIRDENASDPTNDGLEASVPRRYYATLLSSVGLQRAMTPQNIEPNTQISREPNLITAYVFNPLLDFWQMARNNLNLNYFRRDVSVDGDDSSYDTNSWLTTITTTDDGGGDDTDDDYVENNDKEIAFNPLDNGLNGSIVDENAAAVDSSDIVVGNANSANHSLPFKLNVNSARIKENIKESSRLERAILAFQNAFYKYAPPLPMTMTMSSRSEFSHVDVSGNVDAVQEAEHELERTLQAVKREQREEQHNQRKEQTFEDEAVDMHLRSATALPSIAVRLTEVDLMQNENGTNLNGNGNDNGKSNAKTTTTTTVNSTITMTTTTESQNIQIIPSHQMLTMKQQQQNGILGGPGPAESAGIYVLEVVGSVVGLTWGAFSQIQNWFHKK